VRRLFPETFEAPHGAPPDIRAFSDYGKIADWVAGKIRQLADEKGYSNVHFVCKN
jgi:hypothetical protein